MDANLPAEARDAFFQLVLYPIKASANVQSSTSPQAATGCTQSRDAAKPTMQAARVRETFAIDGKLVDAYHTLARRQVESHDVAVQDRLHDLATT